MTTKCAEARNSDGAATLRKAPDSGPAVGFGDAEPYRWRWAAMVVLILAFALDLLNVSIVNVALPAIGRGLGTSAGQLEWVSAAYPLAFAAVLITSARLGDLVGRRRVLLIGLVGFAVASLASALAPTAIALIAARAAQGVAAALIAPQVTSLLYVMFSGRERATVFGLMGISGPFAQSLGLVAGGGLVSANLGGLGWRTIFLLSVPIAVVLVGFAAWLVPANRGVNGQRPRWLAAAVLTVGLVAIVFPLSEGRVYGWPWWLWMCLVGGVVTVIGLAYVEHRVPNWRAGALLPTGLLRRRNVAAGLAVMLIGFASFSGFLLVLSIWLQDGRGYSPWAAGLITIAFCVGSLATAPVVGRLTMRFGRFTVVAGCVVVAVGVVAVGAVASGLFGSAGATGFGAAGFAWALVVPLAIAGAGINLVFPALATLFMGAVPPEYAGSASGIYSTAQQFGGAVGVAALGSVFFAGLVVGDHQGAFVISLVAVVIALIVGAAAAMSLSPTKKSSSTSSGELT